MIRRVRARERPDPGFLARQHLKAADQDVRARNGAVGPATEVSGFPPIRASPL